MNSKAVVYITTQFSNTGDALIIRELLSLVRSRLKLKAIVSMQADQTFLQELNLGKDELAFGGWSNILSQLLVFRLSTCAPVYLFLQPGDPSVAMSKGIWFRAGLFPILWFLRIRIIRVGFSISRITPARLRLKKWLSHWYYFQGLRDNLSLRITKDAKFKRTGYFPDLSLNIGLDYYRERELQKAEPSVIISFRGDNLDSATQLKVIAELSRLLQKLDRPSIIALAQVDRDIEFLDKASELLRQNNHSITGEVLHLRSVEELSITYKRADIVFTNRLHVFLLAALNGALPIALIDKTNDKKIVGILETLGLESFICDMKGSHADQINLYTLDKGLIKGAIRTQKQLISEMIFNVLR